jgi:hypothetical protein
MFSDAIGSLPDFGGGFTAAGVGVIGAGGGTVEFEECCKGNTKYRRTLGKVFWGVGTGYDPLSKAAGSFASKLFKGGGAWGANVNIIKPSNECSDYNDVQKITCFSASLIIGMDFCDTGSGKLGDTININVGSGIAMYTVYVKTKIIQEVAVGCCKK